MRHLERRFLHTAPNEYGDKTLLSVGLWRALRHPLLRNSASEYINWLTAPHLSPRIQSLKESFQESLNTDNPLLAEGRALLEKNLIFFPRSLHLRASPFHAGHWLRDNFGSTFVLNNPDVEIELLNSFIDPRVDPQVPTTKLIGSDRIMVFDDESTMEAIIWRAKLKKLGADLSEDEKEKWQKRHEWVIRHVVDGAYVTLCGTERSWFDTYDFKEQDVITHNQGIFVTELFAADCLGIQVDAEQIKQAIHQYRSLTVGKRLTFSGELPYKDVSSLFGEFLLNELFGKSALTDEIVEATYKSFLRTPQGFPVVVREDDTYLSQDEFNAPYAPGKYHNGAEWPGYSASAVRVVENHCITLDDPNYWEHALDSARKTRNAESINTNPTAPVGTSLQYDPTRIHHALNSLVYYLAAKRQQAA